MQVNGPNPIFERHKRFAQECAGRGAGDDFAEGPRQPGPVPLPVEPPSFRAAECLLMSANLTHDTACAATAPPPPCASASGPGSPMPDLTGFMLSHLTVDDAAHQAVNITS